MREELEGKVALVTGGGRGLGEAICRTLSESKVKVVIADYVREAAQKVAESLLQRNHSASSIELDVSDAVAVEDSIKRVASEYGGIDILVNNAGTDLTVPVEDMPIEEWNRIIGTNLTGPFLMTRSILPLMKEKKSGSIVNIVSTAAKRTWPNASAYHASKWGLLGFSHAMHVEGRPYGVKVTAVVTGGMRTRFLLDRFPDIDVSTLQDPMNVAETVKFVLTQPEACVVPEVLVMPMKESSWP
ncbi:MAG: SDR family oxidoreductase [Oligoflexales bacterium]